jgi:hypothetical protein
VQVRIHAVVCTNIRHQLSRFDKLPRLGHYALHTPTHTGRQRGSCQS